MNNCCETRGASAAESSLYAGGSHVRAVARVNGVEISRWACNSGKDASRGRINDMLGVCLAHRDAEHAIRIPLGLSHTLRIVERDRPFGSVAKVKEECVGRLEGGIGSIEIALAPKQPAQANGKCYKMPPALAGPFQDRDKRRRLPIVLWVNAPKFLRRSILTALTQPITDQKKAILLDGRE